MDNAAEVHTLYLISIYRLRTNKKALSNADNAFLEELAGTAPASAGLPWLVVYRRSPFFGLSARIFKGTNIPSEQSKVLAAS